MKYRWGKMRFLLAVLGVAPPAIGQVWVETDDAGPLPGTSQRTLGEGPLDSIQGHTASDDVVDMYCIQITDPANFSAWTDESNGGSAEFNTMLWLFNRDGIGVLANDDNPLDIIPFHSGMFPPSDDGVTTVEMDGPGAYYLAVSQYWNIPFSADGRMFTFLDQEVISGPDGPGGDQPVSQWMLQGIGGDAPTGAYTIHLTGAGPCPPCHVDPPGWVGVGTGTNGSVFALASYDDGAGNFLYAGGNFDLAGGTTVNNVAAWNGTAWSPLSAGVNGVVAAMNTFVGELWVGGDFTIGDPIPQQVDIARWDGAVWQSVIDHGSTHKLGRRVGTDPARVSALQSLEVPGEVLPTICNDPGGPLQYVGGEFDVFRSSIKGNFPLGVNLAVYTGNDWCDVGGAEFDGSVKALAGFDDGTGMALYVGGGFTRITDAQTVDRFNPINAFGIARWDGQNWSALGLGIGPLGQNPPATVFALAQYFNDNSGGPILVAAGSFQTAGGVSVNGIAKWDGSTWAALGGGIPAKYLPATPFSLHVFDDNNSGPDLYVGGVFTIDGSVRPGVIKWDSTRWSEVGLGVGGLVYAMAQSEFGNSDALYLGGVFSEAGGQNLNNIATWGRSYGGGVHWTSDLAGLWNEPVRWSINPELPGVSDDVCIDRFHADPIVTHSFGDTRIHSLLSSERLVVEGGTIGVAQPSETWNLDLRGGAIVGPSKLTSRGGFVWTDGDIGESNAVEPTTIIANGNALIDVSPGADPVLYGQLELHGLTTWRNSGNIRAGAAVAAVSTLTNTSTGVFEIRTDADLDRNSPAVPMFNNLGTVSKFVGDQDGLTDIDAVYENTGTTAVNSGTLLLRLGGTHTGSFDVAEGATLWVSSPGGMSHTFSPGSSVAGAGRILLGGTVEIADGVNYAFAGTTELLQLAEVFLNATNASTHELLMATAAPKLRGTGTLTVTGPFNWECGFVGFGPEGPVTVIVDDTLAMFGGGTKNIDGHLEILGSATWTGSGSMVATDRAIITVVPKATLSMETDANLEATSAAIPIINNEGTVTKIIGVDDEIADNTTDVSAQYNNAGTTVVQSGSLIVRLGGTHSGDFQVQPGATLGLSAPVGREHHFQSGSSLIADGKVRFGSGMTRIDPGVPYAVAGTTEILRDARVLFNDADSTTFALDHSGGNLAGTGKLTVNGPAVWSGGWIGRETDGPVTVVMNDSLSIETGPEKLVDGILDIRGDATMDTFLTVTGRGVIKTAPAGTYAIQTDEDINGSAFRYGSLGLFDNAGTLTKVASAADGITEMTIVFQNTGTVRIDSGALRFMDAFTQTEGATILNGGTLRVEFSPLELLGGTLTGNGMILGNVNNTAVVSPGVSIGRFDISGNYTQSSHGAFHVEIGGSSLCTLVDELAITGHASLAGALEINLIDGCMPSLGQTFTIMTYASHDGAFERVTNRCAGAGLMFAVNYDATKITLEVVEQPAPNADLDFNARVDLRDMARFQRCFSGSGNPITPCCEPADLNLDASIDLADLESFTSLIAGP